MRIALCGTGALKCWRDAGFSANHCGEKVPLPDGFIPSIDAAEAVFLSQRYGIELPICSMVAEAGLRKRGKVLTTRLARWVSESDCLVRMGKTSFCVSPELALLQSADDLSQGGFDAMPPLLYRDAFRTQAVVGRTPGLLTALAACEFMSNYAIKVGSADGFVRRYPPMSIEGLDGLLISCSDNGVATVREARKWVFANSNSPEETSLAFFLGQPMRFGGLGMGVPRMNYEVTVTHRGRPKTRYIDLCYPQSMLAIEMNSRRYHPGENAAADDERRNEIAALGYQLVVITPEILFDADLLHETMAPFRRKLGLGRVIPRDYRQRRADLRELVFEFNNTECHENRRRMLGPQLSVGRGRSV